MNACQKYLLIAAAVVSVSCSLCYWAGAAQPGPKVSENGNKHNLSSIAWKTSVVLYKEDDFQNPQHSEANTSKYRASASDTKGQQICIFCHTPHNSNNTTQQTPLWNRAFSSQTFSRYSSTNLQIRGIAEAKYYDSGSGSQPDGVSKLCLSCHDGVSSLGGVRNGAPIVMVTAGGGGGGDVITGDASFKPDNNKMKQGHHPVSFNYDASIAGTITTGKGETYALPSSPESDFVKLDKNLKMQCTTCHNPHQNQSDDNWCYFTAGNGGPGLCSDINSTGRKVAPFWVYHKSGNAAVDDHDDVCKTCHTLVIPPNSTPWVTPP